MNCIFMLFLALTQSAFPQDLSELKKSNFASALYGLDFGNEVSPEILSSEVCSKFQNSPELSPDWRSSDWCEHLQAGKADAVCAKKVWKTARRPPRIVNGKVLDPGEPAGSEFCYLGGGYMRAKVDHPSPLVALHQLKFRWLNPISEVPDQETELLIPPGKNANDFAFRLYPISFDGKGSARYLISWYGRLVGFASSSEVPEKLDPKYFLIQSEKKYGPSGAKNVFKSPLQDRFKECWTWNGPKEKFAQVTCIIPKDLSRREKPVIQSVFLDKQYMLDLIKAISSAVEAQDSEAVKATKSKSKEDAQNVDY